MPYTYATFAQAKASLAARLFDAGKVFWTDAELGAYLVEALRTWNAYANFWREEFTMPLVQSTVWYDITDPAVTPNTLRPITVTDVDLFNLIEYHFLEPATGAVWTGSLQFDIQDLLQAVQRRRDELLSGSGCTITRTVYPAVPGRIFLNDYALDIRRVAWLPVANPAGYTKVPLWKDDRFALESYENDYTTQTPGTPSTYQQSTEPPLAFDVDVPPGIPGEYEVLTVNAGVNLNAAAPSTLSVPDDFAWVIKFGAMGDLLNRDSNARDSMRARYCNLRYSQGMAMLFKSSAVLSARLNNVPIAIDAVQNADDFRPNWQAEAAAQPDLVLSSGLNLFGFAPTPDAGPYSVTLSVVRNAPIPANDGAYLQVGRDEYDVILDYAVHLASFKMGGAEFLATIPLLQRFMKQAALYNSKLAETGEYNDILYQMSQLQLESNPVFMSANPDITSAGQEDNANGG